MSTEQLKLSPTPEPPEPSPDLWRRIASVHLARRARKRRLRVASAAAVAFVALGAYFALPQTTGGATDWQARAQALELELRSSPRALDTSDPTALATQSQLAQVDGALQSAYDRGADARELSALWKQRSELLSTLLTVRQVKVAVTRI